MAKKRAGWERMLYRGTAGSTAGTLVDDNVIDIDVGGSQTFSGTTDRGAGTNPPKETEQLVALSLTLSFSMLYKDGDTNMSAFLAAARTGTAIAIKVLRISGGETEVDGDFYLEYDSPGPLSGGQEVTFTCHATDDGARDWTVG